MSKKRTKYTSAFKTKLVLELLQNESTTRLLTKNGRIQIAKDIKKSGMITSAIQQIVNTDRAELKDFLNEVDKQG
jgi:hypothetical protein